MFIRKTKGKRVATLPDGSVLTQADLPPPDARWVASRKAVVIKAIACGIISRDDVLKRYDLSEEELESWQNAYTRHGQGALRSTALQKYRQL